MFIVVTGAVLSLLPPSTFLLQLVLDCHLTRPNNPPNTGNTFGVGGGSDGQVGKEWACDCRLLPVATGSSPRAGTGDWGTGEKPWTGDHDQKTPQWAPNPVASPGAAPPPRCSTWLAAPCSKRVWMVSRWVKCTELLFFFFF